MSVQVRRPLRRRRKWSSSTVHPTIQQITWLLSSDEPWTCYRACLDLLHSSEQMPEVQRARAEMVAHPLVRGLMQRVTKWPDPLGAAAPVDASHPGHVLRVLADFGLRATDPGVTAAVDALWPKLSASWSIPSSFTRAQWRLSNEPQQYRFTAGRAIMLDGLLALGFADDERVAHMLDLLVDLSARDLWRYWHDARANGGAHRSPFEPNAVAPLYLLNALSHVPALADGPMAQTGVEHLLSCWQQWANDKALHGRQKTDFYRLAYPFVGYNILHLLDLLSRFAFAPRDPRYGQMVDGLVRQATAGGYYRAGAIHPAWSEWSFGNRRAPSPWLTLLAIRIQERSATAERRLPNGTCNVRLNGGCFETGLPSPVTE